MHWLNYVFFYYDKLARFKKKKILIVLKITIYCYYAVLAVFGIKALSSGSPYKFKLLAAHTIKHFHTDLVFIP